MKAYDVSIKKENRCRVLTAVKRLLDFWSVQSYYSNKGRQRKTPNIGVLAGSLGADGSNPFAFVYLTFSNCFILFNSSNPLSVLSSRIYIVSIFGIEKDADLWRSLEPTSTNIFIKRVCDSFRR